MNEPEYYVFAIDWERINVVNILTGRFHEICQDREYSWVIWDRSHTYKIDDWQPISPSHLSFVRDTTANGIITRLDAQNHQWTFYNEYTNDVLRPPLFIPEPYWDQVYANYMLEQL